MRLFNGAVLITALLASLSTTTAAQQPPVSEQPTMVVQTGHVGRVNVAAFSNDSRLIATGDHRGSILVWQVESARQLWGLAGHSDGIQALAFSPDGRWLASSSGFAGSFDVRVWDLATGRQRLRLEGHKDLVLNLAFSPDSRHLATAGDIVRIWDVTSGEVRQLFLLTNGRRRAFVTYSPDGRTLAIREDEQLTLVRVSDGDVVRRFPLTGTPLRSRAVFSLNGTRLATIDNRRLRIWDPASGRRVLDVAVDYRFGADVASSSADGRELAINFDSRFEVRDAATGRRLRPLGQPAGSISLLSPNWRHFTDQSGDQRLLTVKPTASGQPEIVLSGARVPPAGAVAFSKDGTVLATKAGKRFWIWPLGGGEPRAFDGHDGSWGEIQINMLAFLPNGRRLISADWTGRIVQRDLESGATERSIDVPTRGSTRVHAISADGRWLVSAQQQSIALFELPAWQIRRTWSSEHRDIAISASGRYVASASFSTDPRVRRPPWIDLWDAQSDAPRTLIGHKDWVARVAFGAGDKWLASVDFTGTIKIWDARPEVF
jgi:WD40 repeat protein